MFNVLLDPLPTEWNGCRIDSAFQNGIQIMQVMMDNELSESEKVGVAADLLFLNKGEPGTIQEAAEAIGWFMNGWNTDNRTRSKKKEEPVIDFDMDQWRIYSAFQSQYGINLNTASLHFWEFMGLLTTLPDCAFTRVADIRAKKLNDKMSREERSFYADAKERYKINGQPVEEAETEEDREATEEFLRFAGLR